VSTGVSGFKILIRTGSLPNIDEQITRIDKQIKDLDRIIDRCRSKLENKQFLAKAPVEIVTKEQNQLADSEKQRKQLAARRGTLTDS